MTTPRFEPHELSAAPPLHGPAPEAPLGREPGKPVRVLVVDDDDVIRDLLGMYLDASGCCTVVGQGLDGHDAIRLAAELAPDVVVLDITMPGLNGLDALPSVRQVAPQARILMYSSRGASEIECAFQRGAHAFCPKDETLKNVVQRIIALACQ
jgi:DNA-binding NarL/FixJ family response regulator